MPLHIPYLDPSPSINAYELRFGNPERESRREN